MNYDRAAEAAELMQSQRFSDAKKIFDSIDPSSKNPVITNFKGFCQIGDEDYSSAKFFFIKSMQEDDTLYEPHMGLGHVQSFSGDYEDAINSYATAIDILKRYISYYDPYDANKKLITLKNDIESCKRSLGSNEIKIYDYYTESLRKEKLHYKNTTDHSKLLVDLTQGIGEQIMAFRFLDFLEGFDQIDVLCDDKLVPLFSRCNPSFNYIPRSQSNVLNHSCIMSGLELIEIVTPTTDDLKNISLPILTPDQIIREKFVKRFGENVIGLTWASPNSHDSLKYKKSFDPNYFNQIEGICDSKFISLQYGEANDYAPSFVDKRKDIDIYDNIEQLFALVSICKCVVGSSNGTQSVAGSLNIPSYNLMHSGEGMVWLWDIAAENKSLLYPSVTIIKTPNGKSEWNPCFEEVKKYL